MPPRKKRSRPEGLDPLAPKRAKRSRKETPLSRFRKQMLQKKKELLTQQRQCSTELKSIIRDLGKLKRKK